MHYSDIDIMTQWQRNKHIGTCYTSQRPERVALIRSAMTDSDGLQRHSSPKEKRANLSMSQVSREASDASNSFEAPI